MVDNEIDFTNCEKSSKSYGGFCGTKVGIIYNDEDYMLKFPPKPVAPVHLNFMNACVTEHISCSILKTLDIQTQDTILGTYDDKVVVACKDFIEPNEFMIDFVTYQEKIANGYDADLGNILNTIEAKNQFAVDEKEVKEMFWDMFIADALLANSDRHNGNWGFIANVDTQTYKRPAPVFDCGCSLFSQYNELEMKNVLLNKKDLNRIVYDFPPSVIRRKDEKINPYDYLLKTKNKDCINSLKKIGSKIDLNKINEIISSTPYISDNHKKFLQTVIQARKEKIIDVAIEKHLDHEKKRNRLFYFMSLKLHQSKDKNLEKDKEKDKNLDRW